MGNFLIGMVIGCFIGSVVGAATVCLCAVSKENESKDTETKEDK